MKHGQPPFPGKLSAKILERYREYAPDSMGDTSPLVWEKAEECRVWDADGREYIHFTSGVLVLNVGHSHPRVTAAIVEQAGKFLNCYAATSEVIVAFQEQLNCSRLRASMVPIPVPVPRKPRWVEIQYHCHRRSQKLGAANRDGG